MKKLAIAAIVAAAPLTVSTVDAADMDFEQVMGLIISGSYESWNGIDIVGAFKPDPSGESVPEDDVHFVSGGEARLSLPLAATMSLQQDVKYQINSELIWKDDGAEGVDDWYGYQFQSTTHWSIFRDPNAGLLGAFGGFGVGQTDNNPHSVWFAGGEFQFYSGDFVFQGQAGYFDGEGTDEDEANDVAREAFFGRAVARWFMTPDSRLQVEGAYVDGKNDDSSDVVDDFMLVEWGVRYDTILPGLPIVGDTNVFLKYVGHYAESHEPGCGDACDRNPEYFTGHLIALGGSWYFGGPSRRAHEMYGVALDSPDIVRWSGAGEVLD